LQLEGYSSRQVLHAKQEIEQRQNAGNTFMVRSTPVPIIHGPQFPQVAINSTQISQPAAPRRSPVEYFNQTIRNGQWSVMWEPSKTETIPLILDRSDRQLLLTDRVHQTAGIRREPREWNNLGFEEGEKFYIPLLTVTRSMGDEDIHHAPPAQHLSLVEPCIRDFQSFHRPRFETPPHSVYEVHYLPYDEPDSHLIGSEVSCYIKDLDSLSGRAVAICRQYCAYIWVIIHNSRRRAQKVNQIWSELTSVVNFLCGTK
jgi:hypothetical protein